MGRYKNVQDLYPDVIEMVLCDLVFQDDITKCFSVSFTGTR